MTKPATVAWIFANQDEKLAKELIRFTSSLEAMNLIKNWWPDKILPGMPWRQEIEKNLRAAQMIVLLASPDLFSDDRETWRLAYTLAKENERIRLVPIHLRYAILPFELTPFQALPRTGTPISTRKNRDECLLEVVQGLRELIQFQSGKQPYEAHRAMSGSVTRSPLPVSMGLESTVSNGTKANRPPPDHAPSRAAVILHLSDLYFSPDQDPYLAYAPLNQDLRSQKIARLDAVVLSGNIAKSADPRDYDAAAEFLSSLMDHYQVSKQQLVLVPGATDVNMEASRQAYQVARARDLPKDLPPGSFLAEGEYGERRIDEKYPQRFKAFAAFYQRLIGREFEDDANKQYQVVDLAELGICFLGLNSAWQLDHLFPERATVNDGAKFRGLEQLPREKRVKIAVFHHALSDAGPYRTQNQSFMETLAANDVRLILHGQRHKTDAQDYLFDHSPDGRRMKVISGGTFSAPTHDWAHGFARQYNVLRFEETRVTVTSRQQRHITGIWEPDARWRTGPDTDPRSSFPINL